MAKVEILIVEDELLIANQIAEFIKEIGYAVCGIAKSADKAIKEIKNNRPDLILSAPRKRKVTGS